MPGIIHRQHRLGSVESLHLGFLVHAQHHRPFGRVVVQADHVDHLLHEQRVGGQLDRVGPVRLEAEVAPDPADGRLRQPGPFGHRRPRPVGGVAWGLFQRRDHHLLDLVKRDGRRPTRPILIDKAIQTQLQEPPSPLAHSGQMHAQIGGHLNVGRAFGARQHDARTHRQHLRRLRPPGPAGQRRPFLIGEHQRWRGTSSPRHPTTLPTYQANFRRDTLYGAPVTNRPGDIPVRPRTTSPPGGDARPYFFRSK
jgi:hypothetical protein